MELKENMPEGKRNHTQDHGESVVDLGLTSRLLIPGLACLSTKKKTYKLCIKQMCLLTDTHASAFQFSYV